MRRFVPLLLAVLVLAPAALAQQTSPTRPLTGLPDAALSAAPLRVAPTSARSASVLADTLVISNIPAGVGLSLFSFSGEGGIVTGTNDVYDVFGSGYTLPDEGDYVSIGVETSFFDKPSDGQTFRVSVFNGTLEDGPQGDAIYTQVFDASVIIPPVTDSTGTTVFLTPLLFDEPVALDGPVFFITYDFAETGEVISIISTEELDVSTPETVVFRNGGWQPLEDIFSDPLEILLLADALVQVDQSGVPVPIVEARAAGDGATVTFEGVVTRSAGAFTYLQDETGGLAIRQTSGAFFDEVQSTSIRPGRILRVTGTLSEFNGLLQINGGALESYAIRGATAEPLPQEVTLAELASNGEAYESELVLVPDVTFTDLADNAPFEAATTYAVSDPTDASNAVSVRVPNAEDSDADGTDFTGSPARVRGVLGQNSAGAADVGYQILLIRGGDVQPNAVAVGESPDGRLGLSGVAPNPSAEAGTVTVSLAAAGPGTLTVVDVLGREVARVLDGPLAAGAHLVRLDVSGLPAGTYLVRLAAGGATAVRPFTVAR